MYTKVQLIQMVCDARSELITGGTAAADAILADMLADFRATVASPAALYDIEAEDGE